MLFIFHGPDLYQSRKQLNHQISQISNRHTLRLDKKSTQLETVNNFLNTFSLLDQTNVLVLEDFFSIPSGKNRSKLEEIIKNSDHPIFIWHPKKLTISQQKIFPSAKFSEFNLSSQLFSCVYSIKPGNLKTFNSLFDQIKDKEPFELILHLIKSNLRKQLTTFTRLNQNKLEQAYKNLIELDFQSKNGTLMTKKEIALSRIIFNLIN